MRRILQLLRLVSPGGIARSLLVLGALSALEGVGLLLLLPLLQLVGVGDGGVRTQGIVAGLERLFEAVGLAPTLGTVLTAYLAIVAVQTTLQRWHARLVTTIEIGVVLALRRRLYEAIAHVRWEFFVRQQASSFMHALTEEVGRVAGAAWGALDLGLTVALVIAYGTVALYVSPLVTLVVAAVGLGLMWLSRRRGARAAAYGHRTSEAMKGLFAAMTEHVGAMKTIRAYGADELHVATFDRSASEVAAARLAWSNERARFRQILTLASTVGLATVVFVAIGVFSLPTTELLVLVFVFARLLPRMTSLQEKVHAIAGELPAFDAVLDLERRCLESAELRSGRVVTQFLERQIRVEGVTYTYPGQKSPVVASLDLNIAAGATTAIVGPSGAGKTTIADLLMGLLEPQAGSVLVDETPLTAETMASWRGQIGYVSQEPLLFHDTIRANLVWARPGATDHELWEALRLAAADAFVAAMPEGLETIVGDRGGLMSGGERQRLSLARALLRRPRLLVLDEATSSLDSENETRIQTAIDRLHTRVTIVIIAHRLSTIRHADVIHVIDAGQVVESGTWEQLMSRPQGRLLGLSRAQRVQDTPAVVNPVAQPA